MQILLQQVLISKTVPGIMNELLIGLTVKNTIKRKRVMCCVFTKHLTVKV